ncbi:MAG: FemAB family XrtA/PEP-CTERM system-associated protein [Acidobacteriota bacterium]
MTVRDDAPPEACDAYLAAHPYASPYHGRAWMSVIGAAFGHETKYLVAETAQRVIGVLPLVFFRSRLYGRFTVSMPFLNYGGVLADGPAAEHALLERAIEETARAGGSHLELRHTQQHFPSLTPKRHKVAMVLRLRSSAEQQWNELDRKARNQVRKAEKDGLEPTCGGAELLSEFYSVFAHHMRDLGTPVYSARFFQEVVSAFPDRSRLFVIRAHGQPVAASVVHWHGNTIEVPWAAALRAFNPSCANVLLYWTMVRFAADRGFQTFDLGRSTPGEGTYVFKKGWGAEPRDMVWEYWTARGRSLPELSPKNPRFRLAIRAWQHLPVPLATRLGPLVVRNIP